MPAIEPVDERLAVLQKRPLAPVTSAVFFHERGVNVLAKIDPLRLDVRVQLIERGDLLRHGMSAIVDEDGGGFVFEPPAAGIDVDTDDARPGAEVVAPHLQRPAMKDADFD